MFGGRIGATHQVHNCFDGLGKGSRIIDAAAAAAPFVVVIVEAVRKGRRQRQQ